jgi:hypothetical protein
MYFERKMSIQVDHMDDFKGIETKMSEIRFAPEIQCDTIFDEANVATIILAKCMMMMMMVVVMMMMI